MLTYPYIISLEFYSLEFILKHQPKSLYWVDVILALRDEENQ